MRNKILIIIVLLAAIALSACAGVAAAQGSTSTSDVTVDKAPVRTINVSGHGEVSITPDIAYITIGVHTEGKDAAEVVATNNSQTQKVMDALKKAGVADKDMRTTNFSIYPQQQYDPQGKPTGDITYIVDNSIFVTVHDLNKIGSLLDAAVKAGANSIYGISFDLEDKSAAMSEARKNAVNDAQTQANELADAAGVTLGDVITISTAGGAMPVVMYEKVGIGGGANAAAPTVPVTPGQMTITADVSMIFGIQ